jgi:hypothetical protein
MDNISINNVSIIYYDQAMDYLVGPGLSLPTYLWILRSLMINPLLFLKNVGGDKDDLPFAIENSNLVCFVSFFRAMCLRGVIQELEGDDGPLDGFNAVVGGNMTKAYYVLILTLKKMKQRI